MIKSVFNALITANWGDITSPKRVPLKDREVANSLRDEIWATPITENSAGTLTMTTKTNSFINYYLTFHKVGNCVTVIGSLDCTTSSGIGSGSTLITITNSEFFGRTSLPSYVRAEGVTFIIDGNTIKCFTNFLPLVKTRLNFQYFTND